MSKQGDLGAVFAKDVMKLMSEHAKKGMHIQIGLMVFMNLFCKMTGADFKEVEAFTEKHINAAVDKQEDD